MRWRRREPLRAGTRSERRTRVPRGGGRAASAEAHARAPGAARPGGAGGDRTSERKRVVRFLAATAFLCGIASFPRSSAFDIRSVAVDGNRVLTTAEVLRRAGIGPGTGIFTVNAGTISRRLREDPRVFGASVAVRLPDRVTIHVRERSAVAALRVPDGYVLLGRDGVAIAPAASPGPLPALTADRLDLPGVEPGTVVPSADARLGAAIAGSLPEELRPDVAGIRIDRDGEVVLYTRDRVAVKVGGPPGIDDRIARLPAVLGAVRAGRLRVEYVDLRFPGTIIVRPAGGVPSRAAPGGAVAPLPVS